MLTTSSARDTQTSLLNDDTAILVSDASVRYRMPTERINTLKERAIRALTRRTVSYHDFWALHDASLQVRFGESVALVGRNGAGKSTLLKVIARVVRPTTGRVIVRGVAAPIIELGAGFHPELTGRENIFLNGAMLGFSEQQMRTKFDNIVDFSELGAFIESPLRTYSSGMTARLAFAVAAEAEPDILIIDEVLGVGDEAFQKKCVDRLLSFRAKGVTLLYVTHALDSVPTLCDRALWIEAGGIKHAGPSADIVDLFRESMARDASRAMSQAQ